MATPGAMQIMHTRLWSILILTCDFPPGWRLTLRGVTDVKSGEIVTPPLTY
jgi:hypothetical protein